MQLRWRRKTGKNRVIRIDKSASIASCVRHEYDYGIIVISDPENKK